GEGIVEEAGPEVVQAVGELQNQPDSGEHDRNREDRGRDAATRPGGTPDGRTVRLRELLHRHGAAES
ncbi:MAG: hypothetical protein ABSA21_12620, partial [Candidatus Limnocylindrales bacterium]